MKEKHYPIKAKIKRCMEEEEKLHWAHFSTLKNWNVNSSIAGIIENIVEFDGNVLSAKSGIFVFEVWNHSVEARTKIF